VLPPPAFAAEGRAFLEKHCASCHGGVKPEAGLDVAALSVAPARLEVFTRLLDVRQRVTAAEMPPAECVRPAPAETERFLASLDAALIAGDAALPPDPGRVTVRRLSRFEYGRTVKHLLALEFEPGEAFPADDLAYGFDNVGDVLSVSPLLLEKYADAAAEIARRAVWLEDPDHPAVRRLEAEALGSSLGPDSVHGDIVGLYANGTVTGSVDLPRAGQYLLKARAFGQQAGPDACRMAFLVDGEPVATVDVKETRAAPAVKEHRLALTAGRHAVAVAFTNDYYRPTDPDPAQRDRNLIVDWLEVVGPVDRMEVPASHGRVFAKDPGKGVPKVRAVPLLRDLAARAWRRPVSADEVKRLADLVQSTVDKGKHFEEGVGLALQAVLVSPHFLFRLEPGAATGAGGNPKDLDGHALATRLSYFLWSSLPDDALLVQAARGRLSDPDVLVSEAQRMLADPKAFALAENFAVQWLELRNLAGAAPDPERFAGFEAVRGAMRREAELLFAEVLREGRDVRDLLAADFTYVNGPLAAHYGLPGVEGEAFRRVALEGDRRGGVLTLAGVLTVTSNPTRTSPVKRGKWVLENVLDAPARPPLPGVDSLDETAVVRSAASLREKLEAHRAKAECAVCHARMDALGFALERYDAVGRWRETDEGGPVDARGTLPDGRALDGPGSLRAALKVDDAFLRCLARKLFTFALGRTPTPRDGLALFARVERLPAAKVTLEDLILAIVKMEAFRQRRPGA
jgi:mono/diheme cytochrome c family protein